MIPALFRPLLPPNFSSKFKAILDKHEIDAIGVCYSPPLLKPEYRYLVMLKHDNRSQIINQALASSIDRLATRPRGLCWYCVMYLEDTAVLSLSLYLTSSTGLHVTLFCFIF